MLGTENNQLQQIGEAYVGKPVHQMSGQFQLLVTSHSDRQIHIFDLSKVALQQFNPIAIVESQLKSATSAICCFGSGKGFAVGSVEGRGGVVKVDLNQPEEVDAGDCCFKCHRKDVPATTVGQSPESECFTVHAMAFNKVHLATDQSIEWVEEGDPA